MGELLRVSGIRKTYAVGRGVFGSRTMRVCALDGVDLDCGVCETVGLVGESGCGKTTLAKIILRLENPDEGSVHFDGMDMTHAAGSRLRELRKGIQVVFQDPFGSLNPRMKVMSIIEEPMIVHGTADRRRIRERAVELASLVGISADMLRRYPHEFSGGQRQRICIARALAINPRLVVLDEPVSSLDVSIQAQVLNLLVDLQERLKLSYLFISHDLSVIGYLSHRTAVMEKGRIVETAPTGELFARPLHPYTRTLMESVPEIARPGRILARPQASRSRPGHDHKEAACVHAHACEMVQDVCRTQRPALTEVAPGHFVACHVISA